MLAGVIGGVVGTWAMAACGQVWSTFDYSGGERARRRRLQRAGVGARYSAQSEPRSHEDDNATSELLARKLAGGRAPRAQRAIGSLTHYAFGATAGAAYAIGVDSAPPKVARVLTAGRGLLYASLVWLLADEIAVPLTGLAPLPQRSPLRLHAYALAGHFAYGLALEQARRTVSAHFTDRPKSSVFAGAAKTHAQVQARPRVETRN